MSESTTSLQSKQSFTPVFDRGAIYKFWFWTGVFFIFGELYVWLSWITGPNFVPTDPGSDPISQFEMFFAYVYQIGVPLLALACIWFWIIKPWRREGKMTTDGMLAICMAAIVIWDPTYNYASTALFYNSHYINFGSWTMGSMPGWISPKGNLLPEPIVVTVPGYLALVYGQAVFVCWALRKFKQRFPATGMFSLIFIIIASLTIIDSLIEISLIRTGVYAYPAGIEGFTLFFGETYQFPLNEGLFFGGFGVGATAILMFFRNDKGETFVEQGLQQSRYSPAAKQWIKFSALFGYVHLTFFLFYFIPMNWFTLHADRFPEGYPSYMENGMCVYGMEENQCPGPGIFMPRPDPAL